MRYKERAWQRTSSALATVIVIIMSTATGFWFGKQYGAENVIVLREQVEAMTQQSNVLQESVTDLRAEAQTANARYQQLQEEMNAQIPEGPVRELNTLIREQLAKGMDPQRLAFVVRSARPPTGCTDPETKRFVVSTPAYKGSDSAVSVAEGVVTVSGTGTSARNQKGAPEAWYDPALPVTITFESAAGKDTKKGTLPLHHSVVVADREYRFTVEEGSRSFAKVVFDSCAYP